MESILSYAKGPNLAVPQVQGLVQDAVEELTQKSDLQLLGIIAGMVSYHRGITNFRTMASFFEPNMPMAQFMAWCV